MFPSLVGSSAAFSDDVPETKLKEADAQIKRLKASLAYLVISFSLRALEFAFKASTRCKF